MNNGLVVYNKLKVEQNHDQIEIFTVEKWSPCELFNVCQFNEFGL
jgi:hypothetical protein